MVCWSPCSRVNRGCHPVRSRSLVASQHSRSTSESFGRSLRGSSLISAPEPIRRAMSAASCPMETSVPVPALNSSPTTADAGASPSSMNADAVSLT